MIGSQGLVLDSSARSGRAACYSGVEEELGEVFESVIETLHLPSNDADQVAACNLLLRHLAWARAVALSDII